MQFSTLNESSLHKSLKNIYAELYSGKTEVKKYGHIYDIVTKNDNIIEIQTKNLAKLLPKILDTIDKGHNVKLVHPIILENKIELYDTDHNLISRRKSPKKENLFSIFNELTGIYSVLLNPHFSLEIVHIKMTEERIRMADNVQSQNKRRKFKKSWIKSNKKLEEIIQTTIFNKKEDYLALLPSLPETFCAKNLEEQIGRKNNPHLVLWVLSHMQIIEHCQTKNRTKYYKVGE